MNEYYKRSNRSPVSGGQTNKPKGDIELNNLADDSFEHIISPNPTQKPVKIKHKPSKKQPLLEGYKLSGEPKGVEPVLKTPGNPNQSHNEEWKEVPPNYV